MTSQIRPSQIGPGNSVSLLISLIFVVCMISLPSTLSAKKIYSWTDANGVKHFGDKPPTDKQQVQNLSTRQLDVEPQAGLRLRVEQQPGVNQYFGFNALFGPAELIVRLKAPAGAVQLEPAAGYSGNRMLLPSQMEVPLFGIRAIGQGATYELSYQLIPGDPNAKPDLQARYRLPFAPDQAFRIHQAFGGMFSHKDSENYHAVDFAMPIGTPVHAARAGRVMQIEEDFFRAGLNMARDAERANVVRILHSDGSYAVYAHLDLESVQVGVGQYVEAGEVIARSGNTGFSTGPHLHFVVQHNSGAAIKSLPFQFWIGNQMVTPSVGASLSHSAQKKLLSDWVQPQPQASSQQ
jgi:murein DD-endopeptidase MepM/ murein hydrolase activator NlpD